VRAQPEAGEIHPDAIAHLRFSLAKDFPSKPDAVLKVTREFLADSFPAWRVEAVADGLEATGAWGAHRATAWFRVRRIPGGASLEVEVLVEHPELSRSYSVDDAVNPLDQWLQDIRLRLHPRRHTDFELSTPGQSLRIVKKLMGNAISGLLIVMLLIWFAVMFGLLPAIGLATGVLYIPGRYHSPGIEIHGIWARLISAGVLVFFGFGVRSFLRAALRYLRQFRATHGKWVMILLWSAVAVVGCLAGLAILGMIVGDNP
jgi:hypothetical protein